MRFQRARREADTEERILPLINVVFLLLIFFMLAGRLAASDLFQVTPPASAAAGEAGDAGRPGEVVILLAADGRLAVAGAAVERAALTEAVSARLAATPGAEVVLKADAGTEAERVVAVMEALRDGGVAELQLFAQSPKGSPQGALLATPQGMVRP